MELLSLRMKNYRRFNEETTIDFAAGDKNVTIIRAENGAGKTGILMALLFGLFGTVKYEQFQIADDKDFMVSAPLLTNGKTAYCTVMVTFEEDGAKYEIKRTIKANNSNGHILQDNNNVDTHLFKEGIECPWDKKKIDNFMNSIIGENIRGFLFFDGVKYTDLFKQNDRNTKQELQKIIEKMLNINDLDKTVEALKYLASQVSKGANISQKTTTDLANANTDYKKVENEIDEVSEKIKKLEAEISGYKKDYDAALKHAESLNEYREIVENIGKLQGQVDKEEQLLNSSLITLKQSSSSYLLQGIYSSFGKESKETYDKLSVDKKGGADIVRMILDSNKCICCDNPLTPDQRQHLENYLNSLNDNLDVAFEMSNRARLNSHKIEEGSASSFEENLKQVIGHIQEIQRLQKEKVREEGKLPDDQTFEDLNSKIMESVRKEGSFDALIKGKKNELDSQNDSLSELKNKESEIQKKIDRLNEDAAMQSGKQKQYAFYDATRKKLQDLKKRYLKEAQQEISTRANEFFRKLLSPDDRELFAQLKLDDDYSIKVYKANGQETFGQMSAGQKLLASMAFVMGLTATASNAKPTCNFPLVMDTPFSNLDLRNRQSLIQLMPTVVKQWILTPIDTELTSSEIGFFDQEDKVGKVYYLKKNGPSTSLVEYPSILDLNNIGGSR